MKRSTHRFALTALAFVVAFCACAFAPAPAYADTASDLAVASFEEGNVFYPKDDSKLEQFKARVFNGLVARKTSIDVSDIGITANEITYASASGGTLTGTSALAGIVRSHSLFSTMCVSWSGFSFSYSANAISAVNVTYFSTWTQTLLDAFVAQYRDFIANVPANANEFQKACYVHDWVCNHTTYSMQTKYNPEFTIGCIAYGKALCAGYSYAYQFLAQQLGLECNYVSGTTSTVSHAWNKVKICGQWFLLDTTWDDGDAVVGGTGFYYRYFLLNDTEFANTEEGGHNADTDVYGNEPVNTTSSFANKYWKGVHRTELDATFWETSPDLQGSEHAWDEGVVTLEPTTSTEGVRTFTCTLCGTTKTETIAKEEPDNPDADSAGTSSITGVVLGSGTTAYHTATVDQTTVYNNALAQVISWREDAYNDSSIKFKYGSTWYPLSEYLDKIGVSKETYLSPMWSQALERIALQRSIEAWSSNPGHTRLDGTKCWTATYESVRSYAESLAWTSSGLTGAFSLWASEKADYIAYVNGDTSITSSDYGHYLQLINPAYTYYGYANADNVWAGESSSSVGSTSTTATNIVGTYDFAVKLSSDKVSEGTTWTGNDTVPAGTSEAFGLKFNYASKRYFAKGTWNSSNNSVATVSTDGTVAGVKDGSATITLTSDGVAYARDITVGAIDISQATVRVSGTFTYTGEEIKPTVTVTYNGKTLAEGTDYTLDYYNNIDAGTATVTANGMGNYAGSASKTFTIKSRALTSSNSTITIPASSYAYAEGGVTPEPTVKWGDVVLTKDKDYTLTYTNNTEIGTSAKVTITAKGNFSGTKSKTFSIVKATPTYSAPTNLTATYGQTLADVELPDGFTWTSSTSTSVGSVGTNTFRAKYTPTDTTHYKTVTGISVNVTVSAKQITKSMFTVNTASSTYTGSAITKTITSTIGSANYVAGYSDNINAGTATITITGKNNYAGTLTYTFEIAPVSIKNAGVMLEQSSFVYDGSAKTPAPAVTLFGKTLVNDEDYTLSYSAENPTNVGTYTVTVTGKGNYTGSASRTFTITKATPSYIAPEGLVATMGQKLSEIALPDGWAWKDGSVSFDSVGTQSFEAIYTPADTANYNTVTAMVSVVVNEPPKIDIEAAIVALSQDTYVYDGEAKTPALTVMLGSTTLVQDADYTVSYSSNVSAGTAQVVITGIGGYSGTKIMTFKIKKAQPSYEVPTGLSAFCGQKLADIDLPADFSWADAGQTIAKADVNSYKAIYTPEDTENFETISGIDVPVAVEHVWDDGVVTTEPTYSAGGVFTYTCAGCGITKTEVIPKLSFSDVSSSTDHESDINWLADKGVTTGWDNGDGTKRFQPYSEVARCDMAAFLYRLAGSPDYAPSEEIKNYFSDVDESTPHYKEVLWLAEKGISKGWTETDGSHTFRPYVNVARADMAAFLKRLSDYQGKSSGVSSANPGKVADLGDSHTDEILWLVGSGVSAGWDNGDGTCSYKPLSTVKRCDMAAFLHRMSTNRLA